MEACWPAEVGGRGMRGTGRGSSWVAQVPGDGELCSWLAGWAGS